MDALYRELDEKARTIHPPPVDRTVRCWMTFLWRAISLNGMTMMHSHILRDYQRSNYENAWRLLTLRVWAAAVECARFVTAATHPDLYMAVMSGRSLMMPGWASRGMPVPFIFDVAFGWRENGPGTCFVYFNCMQALNCETVPENAFINCDAFLASLLGRAGDVMLHPLRHLAFVDYKHQVDNLRNPANPVSPIPRNWHLELLPEAWNLFQNKNPNSEPPTEMPWYVFIC